MEAVRDERLAPSPAGRAPATTMARTIIGELYKTGG